MAPFMELVVLSQTGSNPLSMSQNFLTWHRTMRSLNSQFETKDVPLLHPGHQFLSKIWLRKSTLVKRTKLKTHLCVISDLLCTLYIWPTRSLLRICGINFWARESASWNWFIITPLPGQNRHYQVKTGISGRSRVATSQDILGHKKNRVVTVHNPQLSEQLWTLSFSLFAHPEPRWPLCY